MTTNTENIYNSDKPILWDPSFTFNNDNNTLTLTRPLRLWMDRQPAGFGTSIPCSLVLNEGVHDKKEIARMLLNKGYFGETMADLKFEKWHKLYNTMEVSLINRRSTPIQYWELHM